MSILDIPDPELKSVMSFHQKRERKRTQIALPAWIRTGCCFVFCTTQWMQRHNIPPTWKKILEKFFCGVQVVGRQRPPHHQEYCSDIRGGCVQCNVSSQLYDFGSGSDCM
jgi:hypothetical protein